MTSPTESDWINAARQIWNANLEGDIWIPEDDSSCVVGFSQDMLGQQDHEIGAWVVGARVWISREQVDAYINQHENKGIGPKLPSIVYE